MESFGRYLRNEREQRGISIEDVARATKISHGQLSALESDDLAALPTITYIKGFIKAYSKYIGIDPNNAMLRFENYLSEIGQEETASQEFVHPGFKKEPPNVGIAIAAGGIILLVIVILLVLVRTCDSNDESFLKRSKTLSAHAQSDPVTDPQALELLSRKWPRIVTAPLPAVPPDSFRVWKTGPPAPFVTQPVTSIESTESPGGGKSP